MDYIKVRPYVANRLGVLNSRYRYADGNVQLWDKDLSEVDKGWVFRKEETVAAIGGLMMDPYRNREEQRKPAEECTPLPMPADPAWLPMEGEEDIEVIEVMETEEAVDADAGMDGDDAEEGGEA